MSRIKSLSRARMALSSLCGIAALGVTFSTVWDEYPGDKPELVQAVSTDVQKFVRETQGRKAVAVSFDSPEWREVQIAVYRLNSDNRYIARAKALLALEKHPDPDSQVEWSKRFERAAQNYQVCSTAKRTALACGFGVLALIATIPISWVIFLLVSWLWYFALDRTRELSTAVQGKTKGDGGSQL